VAGAAHNRPRSRRRPRFETPDLAQRVRMSTDRVSGKSKPCGEPVLEDEDDDDYDYDWRQQAPQSKKSAKSGGALLFQRHK